MGTKRSDGPRAAALHVVIAVLCNAYARRPLKLGGTGIVLSTDEFARRQGLTTHALAAAVAAGDTFCIAVNEQVRWPAVLLELEPQDATDVCRALAGCDGVLKLLILVRSHGALAGHTVSEALAMGKRGVVLRLAREWARFGGSAA